MPDTSLIEPSTMTRSNGRATTSASSASANVEMATARKVHFVLQGKRGVGKNFAASLLAQRTLHFFILPSVGRRLRRSRFPARPRSGTRAMKDAHRRYLKLGASCSDNGL